jgi:hypothetical protein
MELHMANVLKMATVADIVALIQAVTCRASPGNHRSAVMSSIDEYFAGSKFEADIVVGSDFTGVWGERLCGVQRSAVER